MEFLGKPWFRKAKYTSQLFTDMCFFRYVFSYLNNVIICLYIYIYDYIHIYIHTRFRFLATTVE